MEKILIPINVHFNRVRLLSNLSGWAKDFRGEVFVGKPLISNIFKTNIFYSKYIIKILIKIISLIFE